MSSPAAWHTDPTGKHDHRWWDGTKWTEHVADAGEGKIDHLLPGDTPPPPAGDGAAPAAGAGDTGAATDAGAGAGAGGLSGAWEGTADPNKGQASWQQPGAGDPNTTAQQPAWQGGGGAGTHGPAGQPGWDQGGQYAPRANTGTDGVAIAALVIGILSLLTSWFLLGGLGGIVALVLGFVALGRVKRNRSSGRGMAITGIVTGVLAIIVAVLVVVFSVSVFGGVFDDMRQCLEENSAEVCEEQLRDDIMENAATS